MTKRISMRVEDADPRYGRTRDTVLGTKGPIITTGMRILPEPAPEVPPGALGALLDGTSGRPVDANVLADQLITAFDLLPPAELAKLKRILAKYGSTTSVTQLGQANNDAADPLTCGQHDTVRSINQVNADFWAKKAAADNAAQLIR
jgi:hypothetical protein